MSTSWLADGRCVHITHRDRLKALLDRTVRSGEALEGPDMARELTLIRHRVGYLIPALVAVKVPHRRAHAMRS